MLCGPFSGCFEWGLPSSCGVRASRCSGFPCCWAQGPGEGASVVMAGGLGRCGSRAPEHRLSSRGARAELLPSTWDLLPRPGITPMSPALADGFFTPEPPGKPLSLFSLSVNPRRAQPALAGRSTQVLVSSACLHRGGDALCEGRFCRLAVMGSRLPSRSECPVLLDHALLGPGVLRPIPGLHEARPPLRTLDGPRLPAALEDGHGRGSRPQPGSLLPGLRCLGAGSHR